MMHFLQGKDRALDAEVIHMAAFGNSRTGSRACKSSSYNRGHQEQPNEG